MMVNISDSSPISSVTTPIERKSPIREIPAHAEENLVNDLLQETQVLDGAVGTTGIPGTTLGSVTIRFLDKYKQT